MARGLCMNVAPERLPVKDNKNEKKVLMAIINSAELGCNNTAFNNPDPDQTLLPSHWCQWFRRLLIVRLPLVMLKHVVVDIASHSWPWLETTVLILVFDRPTAVYALWSSTWLTCHIRIKWKRCEMKSLSGNNNVRVLNRVQLLWAHYWEAQYNHSPSGPPTKWITWSISIRR